MYDGLNQKEGNGTIHMGLRFQNRSVITSVKIFHHDRHKIEGCLAYHNRRVLRNLLRRRSLCRVLISDGVYLLDIAAFESDIFKSLI